MSTAPTVAIVGGQALRRDINRLATDVRGPLYKAVAAAGKVAAQPVAERTRASLPPSRSRAQTAGRLRGDVRVSGTRTGATVRMGRATVPWAGWVEFGGVRHSPHQSERTWIATGRYLFPAARGLAETTAELYAEAMAHVFDDSASWTNTATDGSRIHD